MVQDNGNLQLKAILNDFTAFKAVELTPFMAVKRKLLQN
jgi:hypothetical protein